MQVCLFPYIAQSCCAIKGLRVIDPFTKGSGNKKKNKRKEAVDQKMHTADLLIQTKTLKELERSKKDVYIK